MKKFSLALAASAALAVGACSNTNPALPDSGASGTMKIESVAAKGGTGLTTAVAPPVYEPAYVDGTTVTISAIFVPQSDGPMQHAAADFYLATYPTDHSLWPSTPPQCNPCDHNGNGTDAIDFHDHVLDSMPSSGHGEFNPLWHVFAIFPVAGKEAQYAALLPMKSEEAINAAIDAGLATKVDLNFYFVCDVVGGHAGNN